MDRADGRLIGRATSGGDAHRLDRGVALAYVKLDDAEPGTAREIDVPRERRPAVALPEPPRAPENGRLRA